MVLYFALQVRREGFGSLFGGRESGTLAFSAGVAIKRPIGTEKVKLLILDEQSSVPRSVQPWYAG
jgi:hypothetical protein